MRFEARKLVDKVRAEDATLAARRAAEAAKNRSLDEALRRTKEAHASKVREGRRKVEEEGGVELGSQERKLEGEG